MKLLISLLIFSVSIFAASRLIPGVAIDDFWTAVVVAIVLGFLNTFLRPILAFLTFPVTVLTLGIFYFILNGMLVMLAAELVPGFYVATIWSGILYSIVVSFIGSFLHFLFG